MAGPPGLTQVTGARHKGVLLDPLTIAAIKAARGTGASAPEIAKALGVSKASVYSHSSSVKRVPCPKCGTPKKAESAQCRRCNQTSPARSSWAQQAPRTRGGPGGGKGRQNGAAGLPGAAATIPGIPGIPGIPPGQGPPGQGPPGQRPPAQGPWQCWASATGAHHWDLDQNNHGVCRCCGEAREFKTLFVNNPGG